jgi:hypothetical protein
MMLVPILLPLGGVLKDVIFRTASCRTFCEEPVLQTVCPASGTGWPPGHFNLSLDPWAFLVMMKLMWLSTNEV